MHLVRRGADWEKMEIVEKLEGMEVKRRGRRRQREEEKGENLKIVSAHLAQCIPLLLNRFRSSLPPSLSSSLPSEV